MQKEPQYPLPFRRALPGVLFLSGIFFLNFLSRVILGPLMPAIETDLGITHADAGHIFLLLSLGNGLGLILSGTISKRVGHRNTVTVSAICTGLAATLTAFVNSHFTLLATILLLGTAVGIYLPSGYSTITALLSKKDWGKGAAVHELAPNSAYIIAPLLAELVLIFTDWRAAFLVVGIAQILSGLLFARFGRGGRFKGRQLDFATVKAVLRRKEFYVITLFFSLAVAASIGPYSMMSLYLTSEHGFERSDANQLLSISRCLAILMPILAGWCTDRFGVRPTVRFYLLTTGILTLLLGLAPSVTLLHASVIAQPLFSTIFFPAGFAALSYAFDQEIRGSAISVMGPINAAIGIGITTTVLGHLGDAGMFHVGFMIQGGLLLGGLVLVRLLPTGKE